MMVVIFLGPPGSGKGTQAKLMAHDHGLCHISTGDLVREAINSNSSVGKAIQSIVHEGGLVGDEIVIPLMLAKLEQSNGQDIVFDGFPRTIEQAEALDLILAERQMIISHVIDFEVSISTIAERIVARYSCIKCGEIYNKISKQPKVNGVCDVCGANKFKKRDDDAIEVVQNRFLVYQKDTAGIRDFYQAKGLLRSVDASLDMHDIQMQILQILKMEK